MSDQTIEAPLKPGAWVELYEDVDMDSDNGATASLIFEGTVDQYFPETGLLSFEENDVGRAEFQQMLEEADGYEVFNNYE